MLRILDHGRHSNPDSTSLRLRRIAVLSEEVIFDPMAYS